MVVYLFAMGANLYDTVLDVLVYKKCYRLSYKCQGSSSQTVLYVERKYAAKFVEDG